MSCKIAVLIPTYNAGKRWEQVLEQIAAQTQPIDKVIIIDSESTDDTVGKAKQYGAEVISIHKEDFTHGYARHKMVVQFPDFDFYVFLTQDAELASKSSVENLLQSFNNPLVGAAFGRQIPFPDASVIESHNRTFNYPDQSYIRSRQHIPTHGFKTIFCSNSFAAYRKVAYDQAGGFPVETNFGEDTLLCAKMILNDWQIAYQADATVNHSHNNTLLQDAQRFYEIGKFHKQNLWLYQAFGKPGGEGFKYINSQLKYVLRKNPLLIFAVIIGAINKFAAYKAGLKVTPAPHKPGINANPIEISYNQH